MIGPLDLFVGLAAASASASLQLRAHALKPIASMAAYPTAPLGVRLALFGRSLVLGGYAVSVLIGDHRVTLTEAVLVVSAAVTVHVLWRNLRRQARGATAGPAAGTARQVDRV